MHDMILIYLDFNGDDVEERTCAEEDIRYMDRLVEKQGWKYSGIANYYVPVERATREETVANVYEVIASDERLKKYSPQVISNTAIEFCSLGEIDPHCMENPKESKYNRYEKYGCKVHIIEVPKEGPIAKVVIGKHVEYDAEQKSYAMKTDKRYAWIYTLPEAVVPGDILLVRTRKGDAYMQVERIINVAGKKEIHKYKNVKKNITATEEVDRG